MSKTINKYSSFKASLQLLAVTILIIVTVGAGSEIAAASLIIDTTYSRHATTDSEYSGGIAHTSIFTSQTNTLICNGPVVDFEAGIPADWTVVNNSPGGIVWTTTADSACTTPNLTNGTGEAACADSSAAGSSAPPYDTELVSNPIDLSNWGGVILDVKAYYGDISMGTNDRFEVDVWDGSVWTNELYWDRNHETKDFEINLSVYAGLPVVQVRFRYYGDGVGLSAQVDDVELTCVPVAPPVIEVDPASLTEHQVPNFVSTQPMTITNSGGSPLIWDIEEDDTHPCDSPTDIPWLNVAPTPGTTVSLSSTVVDVSFDSSGLVPGDYSAYLCVNSDDPVTSVVQVPVNLTVISNSPPICSVAFPSVDTLWPPNHSLTSISILGVSDPDGDPVTITINSIFQDEPTNGIGEDDLSPDGFGIGSETAIVRAERDGSDNGRFYHISFTVTDPFGGTCSDLVLVSVPLNQGTRGVAVDDGAVYDSTLP